MTAKTLEDAIAQNRIQENWRRDRSTLGIRGCWAGAGEGQMSINGRKVAGGKTVYDVRLRDPDGRAYKRTFRAK